MVRIIETVSNIEHRGEFIGAALERIIRRGKIELKMKRLYCFQVPVKHSKVFTTSIKQHFSFWKELIWGGRFYVPNKILEVRVKPRKIITTVYIRAIYEIAKEELRKAAEESGINELVMERNFD